MPGVCDIKPKAFFGGALLKLWTDLFQSKLTSFFLRLWQSCEKGRKAFVPLWCLSNFPLNTSFHVQLKSISNWLSICRLLLGNIQSFSVRPVILFHFYEGKHSWSQDALVVGQFMNLFHMIWSQVLLRYRTFVTICCVW